MAGYQRKLSPMQAIVVVVIVGIILVGKLLFPPAREPSSGRSPTDTRSDRTTPSASASRDSSSVLQRPARTQSTARTDRNSSAEAKERTSSKESQAQNGRISVFCYDVADGDTLRLKDSQDKTIKLRMKGIDAPEFRPLQAYGAESRQAMINKVKGKQIEVILISKDQYDRDLGIVYYQGVNLNEEQIRLGNAWSYAYKRDPEYARMRDLEQEARSAKRGLWALPDPQNPREFRDSHPKN